MFYLPPQKAQKPSKKKVSKTLLLEPPYLSQNAGKIDSNVYVPTYECSAIQRYQNSTPFPQGKKVFFVQTNKQTNRECQLVAVGSLYKRTRVFGLATSKGLTFFFMGLIAAAILGTLGLLWAVLFLYLVCFCLLATCFIIY